MRRDWLGVGLLGVGIWWLGRRRRRERGCRPAPERPRLRVTGVVGFGSHPSDRIIYEERLGERSVAYWARGDRVLGRLPYGACIYVDDILRHAEIDPTIFRDWHVMAPPPSPLASFVPPVSSDPHYVDRFTPGDAILDDSPRMWPLTAEQRKDIERWFHEACRGGDV